MVGDGGFLRQPWVKAGLVRDHDNDKGQEKKRVDVKNWSGDVFVSMHLAIQAEGIVLKKGLAYRATEKRTYLPRCREDRSQVLGFMFNLQAMRARENRPRCGAVQGKPEVAGNSTEISHLPISGQ